MTVTGFGRHQRSSSLDDITPNRVMVDAFRHFPRPTLGVYKYGLTPDESWFYKLPSEYRDSKR